MGSNNLLEITPMMVKIKRVERKRESRKPQLIPSLSLSLVKFFNPLNKLFYPSIGTPSVDQPRRR